MYKNLKVAVVIPSYNEGKLIIKTINTLPDFVDLIIPINDCSTDNTLEFMQKLAKKDKRIHIIDNPENLGLGSSMVKAYKYILKNTKADLISVFPGDAQHDPHSLAPMIDMLLEEKLDYVKPNRFMDYEALQQMPRYRRIGNTIISILTKFSTGYYSIFDSQNGSGVFTRKILERLPLHMIGKRFDYENTLLTALSIISAKVKDHPVPAIYGGRESHIKLLPTTLRALKVTWTGFWKRIYYKYVIYSFHPVALFLISGLLLMLIGLALFAYVIYERVFSGLSPSSGTVMLIVLPTLIGFQLILTAFIMDVNNENR